MEMIIESPKYGKFKVLCDDEDHNKIMEHEWHLEVKNNKFYVSANFKRTSIKIHRLVMDAPKGKYIDHRNGDPLDNRKCNLRICTNAENGMNRAKNKNNTSGYKGVHWYKSRGKWQSQIMFNGKRISLGYFHDKDLAALAYNFAAVEHHGEYASLNIVEV